ncbi:MAG: hypothetical protein H0V17_26875 [Deltaproteobacteria bacterium]|nr:hypothetical protein [Deltaproteobacteria bacterium]
MRLTILAMVAGCGESSSVACDDGTFCPDRTVCGGAGVCLVEADACARFDENTACELDLERGRCVEGACVPGVELIGVAAVVPRREAIEGVEVTARDHPEIVPSLTNRNQFFGLKNIVPDTAVVLELSFPDTRSVVTGPIVLGDRGRSIDVVYGGIPLVAEASLDLVAATTGLAQIPGTGIVSAAAFDPAIGAFAGMSAVLDVGCSGPFYLGAELLVVADATATLATDGSFVFVNCPPGAAALTAGFPGRSCRTLDGIPATNLAIEIVADRLLWLGRITCE